jgi:hypothetical protein
MGQIPDELPVISRGRHLEPEDGGCIMEIVSLLAGERWSDAPRCTHPLLAAVARLVNDEVGDDTRQHLMELVPDLVGAVGDGPATSPAIVRACARAGLTVDPSSRRLRHALATAEDRLANVHDTHWRDVLYTYGPATHAVVRTIDTVVRRDPDGDSTLAELLRECVQVVRERTPQRRLAAAGAAARRRTGALASVGGR